MYLFLYICNRNFFVLIDKKICFQELQMNIKIMPIKNENK